MANLSDYVGAGRKTSEWKLNTNADVATSSNTYETVYSFTGTGLLTAISISASGAALLRQCIIEITVDGGTLNELDMGIHAASNTAGLWMIPDGSNVADNIFIPINQEFKTSILIRAKNDTDTGKILVSLSSSEDQ